MLAAARGPEAGCSRVVDGTGANFVVAMSHDKQFRAVMARPAAPTGLDEFTCYALNRD